MSVLVTGGAGYIGSHMVWQLVDAGEEVVVLDNLSTGFAGRWRRRRSFVDGDVGDEALVGRLIAEEGVDAIIHFAGSIVVPESVADPLGYYLNNTVKSRGADRGGGQGRRPHFIFSSTAAVYGTPADAGRRGCAAPPISPYGAPS
jgi:UDP-glucose 4-epimerase